MLEGCSDQEWKETLSKLERLRDLFPQNTDLKQLALNFEVGIPLYTVEVLGVGLECSVDDSVNATREKLERFLCALEPLAKEKEAELSEIAKLKRQLADALSESEGLRLKEAELRRKYKAALAQIEDLTRQVEALGQTNTVPGRQADERRKQDPPPADDFPETQVAETPGQVTTKTRCYRGEDEVVLDAGTTRKELFQWAEMEGSPRLDLTNVLQELKDELSDWKGSIVDRSRNVSYAKLTQVGGYLNARSATSLDLPQLAQVGGYLDAQRAISLDLPQLAQVGWELDAQRATSLNLPQLAQVGGELNVRSAMSLRIPMLSAAEKVHVHRGLVSRGTVVVKKLMKRSFHAP